MPATFLSESPAATRAWAAQLVADLRPPVVIALTGDLGAGKTQVAQGIAAGLGVTDPVTSPTFTLINEYNLPDGGTLFHVDCYRLGDAVGEAIMLGLEELFELGVVVIEWADRIAPLLPSDRIDIELTDAGPGQRRIQIRNSQFAIRNS